MLKEVQQLSEPMPPGLSSPHIVNVTRLEKCPLKNNRGCPDTVRCEAEPSLDKLVDNRYNR